MLPSDVIEIQRTGRWIVGAEPRPQREAAGHGDNLGIYAERLLADPLPWTRMRAVYLGLVKRYGPGPVDQACGTALDLDVISVGKIASMLAKALEKTTPALPAAAGHPAGRFARDPSEYRSRSTPLTLIHGDLTEQETR